MNERIALPTVDANKRPRVVGYAFEVETNGKPMWCWGWLRIQVGPNFATGDSTAVRASQMKASKYALRFQVYTLRHGMDPVVIDIPSDGGDLPGYSDTKWASDGLYAQVSAEILGHNHDGSDSNTAFSVTPYLVFNMDE